MTGGDMTRDCGPIQAGVASDGARWLRERPAELAHAASCAACFELLEAVAGLDADLAGLAALAPPEDLVARVLAATGNAVYERGRTLAGGQAADVAVAGQRAAEASAAARGPADVGSEAGRLGRRDLDSAASGAALRPLAVAVADPAEAYATHAEPQGGAGEAADGPALDGSLEEAGGSGPPGALRRGLGRLELLARAAAVQLAPLAGGAARGLTRLTVGPARQLAALARGAGIQAAPLARGAALALAPLTRSVARELAPLARGAARRLALLAGSAARSLGLLGRGAARQLEGRAGRAVVGGLQRAGGRLVAALVLCLALSGGWLALRAREGRQYLGVDRMSPPAASMPMPAPEPESYRSRASADDSGLYQKEERQRDFARANEAAPSLRQPGSPPLPMATAAPILHGAVVPSDAPVGREQIADRLAELTRGGSLGEADGAERGAASRIDVEGRMEVGQKAGERQAAEIAAKLPAPVEKQRLQEIAIEAKTEATDLEVDETAAGQPVPARELELLANRAGKRPLAAAATVVTLTPARLFLAERDELQGLSFKELTGYWANTYVPGDPSIRLLAARLAEDRTSLLPAAGRGEPVLDARSRQYRQPFDQPIDAALAVYLHSDKPAVSGRSRLLVQVGLQGTERRSGRRPAMNVGLVVDLRQPPGAEECAALRALAAALSEARRVDDRFSLIVAGPGGGVAVAADAFRGGAPAAVLGELFARERSGPGVGLAEAFELALGTVAAGDDPQASLGASVVLLATASPLGPELDRLARLAHASAVAGVPVSVVGVGADVELGAIDTLVLAGQGNRRLVSSADEAPGAIDRELHAASGVVARAVRLRIRLARGVELVDVLGSYRLDAARAERVREAERSIDQRVARNLGIAADRGDDEEGIQIVIPAYYAGDAHVVLLDVVASGSGAIADVTVRYKDLVTSRNGVARANLSLPPTGSQPGPLERNALKNLVAARVAAGIREAAEDLRNGRRDEALARLDAIGALLEGLALEVPGWAGDAELARDGRMLAEFRQTIGAASGDDRVRDLLADSLTYAAYLKLVPPLAQ